MDRYYKYLSPDAARAVLTNCTLRWSRPSRFNDLFDMAVPYSTDFDSDFVMQRAVELMWERVQNPGRRPPANQMGAMIEMLRPIHQRMSFKKFDEVMREAITPTLAELPERFRAFGQKTVDHLKTIKVLCLSRVHDHNQMWGVYAADHKGVVLEFVNADGVDSPYKIARPVIYSDRAPPLLDDEGLAGFLAGDIALTAELADPLMILKSTHWAYEQELRIVSGEGRARKEETEDIKFHPRELAGVYFGARGSDLRRELESLVNDRYPHAQRWQASQGSGFQIEFTRLD